MKLKQDLLPDMPYLELKGAYYQLERKNKDLLDSLYYAAFVQQGLMPQARHFRKLNQPYFIYYSPLQIIGGDFFWIGKKGDWCLYAVGDCTGHGVGGAMLSTLAIGFLNYVVYAKQFDSVGEILTEIDKKWIETFNHNEDVEVNNDWMEISLVAYNQKTNELQYSGAGSSIMLIEEEADACTIKGNSFPVGGWQIELNRRYTTHDIKIRKPTKIFLYSDGFKDQFGGENDKRYGMKRFRHLITYTSSLNCAMQKEEIELNLRNWRGNSEQTDDICLLRIDL